MISHKYKCILIHIQRTAGSSIEHWLCDSDWWKIQPETKHLTASQAKELYKEYWDEYFTFSFVRNPWDRVVSSLKCQDYFGIHYQRNCLPPFGRRLNFDEYKKKFGAEIILEHDYRFYKRQNLISKKHVPGQIYGNILNEKLDFIGRFETLAADCKKIRKILGIDKEMSVHAQKSKRKRNYKNYYNKKSIEEVRSLYAKDIERFNYEY